MFKRPIAYLKGNFAEFWEFAFKGNLISLAIGVVLGGAFGDLIKSFVGNVFMPVISLFGADTSKGAGYTQWQWRGIRFGAFLGDLVSFLIIATAIFVLMVKVVGWIVALTKKAQGPSAPDAPAEKECPLCLMKIPVRATKCGHCTADLTPAGDGPSAPAGVAPAMG
jgi:large conductance mechanosensitive channel